MKKPDDHKSTVIEIVMILAIAGILVSVAASISSGSGSVASFGINGMVETRCIGGLQYQVGQNGHLIQTIGPNGGGVPCQ